MTNKPSILLTGGAGCIGSHTFVALIDAGFTPVILDDFSNSKPAFLERLQRITGHAVQCQQGGVTDVALMQDLIHRHQIAAAILLVSRLWVKVWHNNVVGVIGYNFRKVMPMCDPSVSVQSFDIQPL